MARTLLLLALLPAAALAACSGRDAGKAPAGACDPPSCELAAGETCAACFAQLGRCCYDDATIEDQAAALAASCESRDDCRRCCDECAARSCEDLRAGSDCANLVK